MIIIFFFFCHSSLTLAYFILLGNKNVLHEPGHCRGENNVDENKVEGQSNAPQLLNFKPENFNDKTWTDTGFSLK